MLENFRADVLKAILTRRINIRECEDYKNTFARIESDCTLRFGFKALLVPNVKETKPPIVNQQCVVYGFQCDLCDAHTRTFT